MSTTTTPDGADNVTAPHDRVGKAIAVGAQIAVMGGGRGTVTAVTAEQVTYTRADGQEAQCAPGEAIVLRAADVAPPDGDDPAGDAPGDAEGQGTPPGQAPPAAAQPPAGAPGAGGEQGAEEGAEQEPQGEEAPDAVPDGADAWLVNDEGTQQAWLRTDEADEPVGYVQTDVDDPATIRRFDDAQQWVQVVDPMGLHPAEDGASPDSPPADDTGGEPDPETKAGRDKGGGDVPPTIANGSFVSWSGGKGRVDLIVTNGKVPGVDADVEGTTKAPAARVVVWSNGKPTGRKIGANVATLRRIAPLNTSSTKAAPGPEALVSLVAEHGERVEDERLGDHARVNGKAAHEVYQRGLRGWPGPERTEADAQQWATGRVQAFLTVAAGGQVKGYDRDRDLLHPDHPEHEAGDLSMSAEEFDREQATGEPVEVAVGDVQIVTPDGQSLDLEGDLADLDLPDETATL